MPQEFGGGPPEAVLEVKNKETEVSAETSEQTIKDFVQNMFRGFFDIAWAEKAAQTLAAKVAEHNQKFCTAEQVGAKSVTLVEERCNVDKIFYKITVTKDPMSGALNFAVPNFRTYDRVGLVKVPEKSAETGEQRAMTIIETLRGEGEIVIFRILQVYERLTGRKDRSEFMRKILLEFSEPITDLDSYRRMSREQAPKLWAAMEAVYGGAFLMTRKQTEFLFKILAKFEGRLGEMAGRAAERLADPKKFYRIKEGSARKRLTGKVKKNEK